MSTREVSVRVDMVIVALVRWGRCRRSNKCGWILENCQENLIGKSLLINVL
jgi:hypothetical protein